MTPDQISTILGAIDRLEQKVDAKADKTDIHRLERKLDSADGRITDIEKHEIRDEATNEAKDDLKGVIWKSTLATITAVGVLVAIAVAVIDHI